MLKNHLPKTSLTTLRQGANFPWLEIPSSVFFAIILQMEFLKWRRFAEQRPPCDKSQFIQRQLHKFKHLPKGSEGTLPVCPMETRTPHLDTHKTSSSAGEASASHSNLAAKLPNARDLNWIRTNIIATRQAMSFPLDDKAKSMVFTCELRTSTQQATVIWITTNQTKFSHCCDRWADQNFQPRPISLRISPCLSTSGVLVLRRRKLVYAEGPT